MSRCVASCATYSECNAAETCWEGGCVPKYAFVGDKGGDPDQWQVALPGGDVGGGCGCNAGDGNSGASTMLFFAVGMLAVRVRRRKRSARKE